MDTFLAHLFSNGVAIALYGWWISKIHAKKVKELETINAEQADHIMKLFRQRNAAIGKLDSIRHFVREDEGEYD